MASSASTPLSAQRDQARRHARAREQHHVRRTEDRRDRRDAATLRAIAEEAAERLADADADTALAWAAEEFGTQLAVACSMADLVLPHLVARHQPWVDTLFLETGYHFAETLGTRAAAESTMQLTIVDVLPERTVPEQDAEFGERLFERDPAACCRMRKVEPLQRSLRGYEAWVTGVRREEAPTRAETPVVTWDDKNGLVKINPLVDWTLDDLLDYAERHAVLLNPLLTNGYPSIGCEPCTKRVAPGEDPRSGRWAGLDKTECGLHV